MGMSVFGHLRHPSAIFGTFVTLVTLVTLVTRHTRHHTRALAPALPQGWVLTRMCRVGLLLSHTAESRYQHGHAPFRETHCSTD